MISLALWAVVMTTWWRGVFRLQYLDSVVPSSVHSAQSTHRGIPVVYSAPSIQVWYIAL